MDKMQLIKELREKTLAGMNDCKVALTEAEWDFTKAVDLVKARGLSQTSRTSQKVAAEGRVIISFDHAQDATLVEVNSNTDFTSGSKEFIDFCNLVGFVFSETDLAAFTGDLSTLPVVRYDDQGVKIDDQATLETLRQELMASTKENIVVRRWCVEEVFGDNRRVFSYTHSNSKLGVLVSMEAPSATAVSDPAFEEFSNNVAMQIAAMSPLAVSADQISQEEKDRQKVIFETQVKEAGKPEASWEKIIAGKTKKWQTEVCLSEQEAVFLTDGSKKSIATLANELSTKLGGKDGEVKILSFQRVLVGEGIEKPKEADYAEEIGKMTGIETEEATTEEVKTLIHEAISLGDVSKEAN